MTKRKGNKLQTPQSAQNNKKKRPLNLHSDPPPKKKKFHDSDDADSDLDNFDFDKVIKKKLLSDKKASPKMNLNKKRNRDDDDSDADFLEINTDDSDLNEFDVDDDSELEPSDVENQPRGGKRNKLSGEVKKNNSCQKLDAVKILQSNIPNVDEAELQKDLESKVNRDKRTLILRNFKDDITVNDINSLTKEITAVRMICCKGKNSKGKKCAFVEFSDEPAAERNKKYLTGKKLNGVEIIVDYVGVKSSINDGKSTRNVVDPKILHVSGLRTTVTEKDLIKLFPGSVKIDFAVSRNDQSRKDFAFVRYSDEAKCLEGHKQGQNMMLDGQKLIVQFAKASTRVQRIRDKKHLREERRKLFKNMDVKDPKSKQIDKPKFNNQEKKNDSNETGSTKSPKANNQSKKPNVHKMQNKTDNVATKQGNKVVAQQGKLAATAPVKKGSKTVSTKNPNPGLTTLRPPNGGMKVDKSSKKKNKKPKKKKVPTATLR